MLTIDGRPFRFSRYVDLLQAVGATITAYWGVSAHNVPAGAVLNAETTLAPRQRDGLSVLYGRAALVLELLLQAAADDELLFVLVEEATLERVPVQRDAIGRALRALHDEAIRPWLACPDKTPTPDPETVGRLMSQVFAELLGDFAGRDRGGWLIKVERDALLELLSGAPNPDDSPNSCVFRSDSPCDADADASAGTNRGTWKDVRVQCHEVTQRGAVPTIREIEDIINSVEPTMPCGKKYAGKTINRAAGCLRMGLLGNASEVLEWDDPPERWPRVGELPRQNAMGRK